MNRKLALGGIVVASLVGLTGCGLATLSAPRPRPKPIKPAYIVPTPKAALAESAPTVQGIVWVLAGNAASKGLYEVSLADRKVIGSVSVTNAATSVAISPTGQLALGAGSGTDGFVEFLNPQTGQIAQTIPVGGAVRSLVASADGSSFYALDRAATSASVTVIDAQTGRITGTVPAALDAVSIVGTPGGSGVYYLQPDGKVSEVATVGGQLETTFSVGHSGRSLALSPDGGTLYVLKGSGGSTNVAVVDVATESVKRALPAAANSVQIALSPSGAQIYDLVGTPAYGNLQAVRIPS